MKYIPIAILISLVAWCLYIFIFVAPHAGYGKCEHCGKTWDVVEGHTISMCPPKELAKEQRVRVDIGMFPVCESCFQKLPPKKLEGYILQLFNTWSKSGTKCSYEEMQTTIENMEHEKSLSTGRQHGHF